MKSMIPGPASKEALLKNPGEQFAFQAGIPPRDTLIIVLGNKMLRIEDREFIAVRDSLVKELMAMKEPGGSAALFSRIDTAGNTHLEDSGYVSEDSHHLLFIANTTASIDRTSETLKMLPQMLANFRSRAPTFELNYLSQGTGDSEMVELIHRDLDHSLLRTLPLTLAILLWAFGSLYAALIPLVIAIVVLVASLGMSALLSHYFGPINATASQLVVLLVLSLGVDYSLFILSRVREETLQGASHIAAIAAAKKSTAVAVLWSGITVALSLFGLLLMNDTILCSMALISIVAVLLTVSTSVWVLPSLLVLAEKQLAGALHKQTLRSRSGALSSWLAVSVRHPLLVLFIGGALVLFVSSYAFEMRLGSTVEPDLLPSSLESSRAFSALDQYFPKLSGTDFSVIVRGKELDRIGADERMQSFVDELQERHESVAGPFETEQNDTNTAARYQFFARGSPNNPAVRAVVKDLRENLFPKYFSGPDSEAYVSGTLPYIVDESRLYANRTPIVFGAVLLLSMVFLLLAFRSVVVPLKAILLNSLSVGASFGVLVLTFQLGGSSSWHYEVVESFVPALLFAILFGLSMDYHLLLLSRIREEVLRGFSTKEAIVLGVQSTSGAITNAALIMVSVFAVLASLELPLMKELGVGLAVAVLLDATVIRTMLLPASMALLGRWNWYLPSWLSWLPEFGVEPARTVKRC